MKDESPWGIYILMGPSHWSYGQNFVIMIYHALVVRHSRGFSSCAWKPMLISSTTLLVFRPLPTTVASSITTVATVATYVIGVTKQ